MLKETIISNWHDHCSGKETFDSMDFYTLLHDDPRLSESQLKDLFKYHESGDVIAASVYSLYGRVFEKEFEAIAISEIDQLARSQLIQVYDFLNDPELDQWVSKENIIEAPLVITDDITIRSKLKDIDCQSNILFDELKSNLDDISPSGNFFFGLDEAIYGFTVSLIVSFHLLKPLYKYDLKLDNYCRLWLSGVYFVLTDNELLVYVDSRNQSLHDQ